MLVFIKERYNGILKTTARTTRTKPKNPDKPEDTISRWERMVTFAYSSVLFKQCLKFFYMHSLLRIWSCFDSFSALQAQETHGH